MDAPHAALLIDFDNVTMGIRSDLQNQLRKLLNSDIIKGKVSVQRAYADWRRYPQYIVPLSEASIDLIFAPAFGASKKNATDIRLAIDALELIFTRPEIGTFILLSGDSDFSALVLKLKEYGKYVIGVGIRESSSDLLIQNCDEYFSYNELTGLAKEGEVDHVRRDPWELVVEAVQKMLNEGDVMRSDRLKQVMQGIDPKFDEKDAGFNRFSKFVLSAAGRGLVSLTKMENGQYAIDLGSNANVPVVMEAAGKAAADMQARSPEARRRRGRKRSDAAVSPSSLVLADSFELLKQALMAIGAVGETSTDREQAREKMIELHGTDSDPVFESRRFLRMLRQAHDADHIELIKSDGDQYQLKLSQKAVDDMGGSTVLAADDKAARDEDAKPTATKKTTRRKRATAKRATTKRTTRAKASEDKQPDETDDADLTAETMPAESVGEAAAGSGETEKKSKAKKTTRRKLATSRRSAPDDDSDESAADESTTAKEAGDDSSRAKKKVSSRKKTSSKRAPRRAKSEDQNVESTSPDSDVTVVETPGDAQVRRNPRFRRGSRGAAPRPVAHDEEPKSSEQSADVAATPRSTSGARTLGLRRGSKGAKSAGPARDDSKVQLHDTPSRAVDDVPVREPAAPLDRRPVPQQVPDEASPVASLKSSSREEATEHGLLGRIRAALHKAVGGEAQTPDDESG
ncbi:MAG: NYN domain-containing protein [Gemmatimonadota bacterium]|nr:MAG: NYN domain-containing protein [Gemmatimonadota bacterium]